MYLPHQCVVQLLIFRQELPAKKKEEAKANAIK
jgi:hypothetical protein